MFLDSVEIGFEMYAKRAMFTSQSKVDRVGFLVPPPSHIIGVFPFIFSHPNVVPIPVRMDVLATPEKDFKFMINGRKTLKPTSGPTQLYLQPIKNCHVRIFVRWLHREFDAQSLRKTQEQTYGGLRYLVEDSQLPSQERDRVVKAGGKFGSLYTFSYLTDKQPVDFNFEEVLPVYRKRDGSFLHHLVTIKNGTWRASDSFINTLAHEIGANNA